MNDIRCTHCSAEFDSTSITAAECPKCGTESLPMYIKDDVTVKVNWHELRVLGIWAENHARTLEPKHAATLRAILKRLQEQHPGRTPLTLSGEVAALQGEGHDVELRAGDGTLLIPRPPRGQA